MITSNKGVRALLMKHRGRAIHIIDPFKIPLEQAVEKARLVAALGYPFLILGSTDYEDFDQTMPAYVDAVKAASGLPVILHFPPREGVGLPLTSNSDGVFCPALLGSGSAYMVWQSFLETLNTLNHRGIQPENAPEMVFSASLTFGLDEKSYSAMDVTPIDPSADGLKPYVDMIHRMGLDQTYLYSRHVGVAYEVCAYFRRHLPVTHVLFVGGCVRSRQQVEAYLEAGADYVVYGGALEVANWKSSLALIDEGFAEKPQGASSVS
jgi:heptaprenylglyceryl phosphate synthase